MPHQTKDAGLDHDSTPQNGQNAHKKGKNYLLCIGIDRYEHCPRLNNAVKDAKDFMNLLVEKYQFEQENCTTIFDGEATRKKIFNAFQNLKDRVLSDDRLIIYFSGHGKFDAGEDLGYWIPVEAMSTAADEFVSNSDIRDKLNGINCHHIFLIADSCFAGSLFKNVSRNTEDPRERDRSRWGLTAGRTEIVDDGRPGTNSPFAGYLLEVLKKNDKSLGVNELCLKVEDKVVSNPDIKQVPLGRPLNLRAHEDGQFFFHLRKNEDLDWAQIDQASETSLRSFLAQYPDTRRTVEINALLAHIADQKRQKEEELKAQQHKADFERAKDKGTVEALRGFVRNCHRDSPHYAAARQLLADAEIEAAWHEAKRLNTMTAYLDFLDNYPKSKYADNCQKRIDDIDDHKEENAWKEAARVHTVAAYREFLSSYPDSKYKAEGQKRINELEPKENEEAAWKNAIRLNIEAAYLDFLHTYPKSKYTDECQKRIDSFAPPPPVPPKVEIPKEQPKPTPTYEPISPPVQVAQSPDLSPKPSFNWWWVAGAAVLLMIGIWKGIGGASNTQNNAPDTLVVNDEAAYNKAQQENTIPAWEAFISQYASSARVGQAKQQLADRRNEFTKHLKDAQGQIKDFPQDAKADIDAALQIDPNNAEAKQLQQLLK